MAERLMYQQIIDTMLLVVTGLLAVSVLIALIGVVNTLSLSTIERTRENSLMSALGLTRRGLRGMLAIEAVLIAGIAAVLGSALGVFHGWMGAESLLGNLAAEGSAAGRLVPTVPWLELAVVVAVVVVAGLLASVGRPAGPPDSPRWRDSQCCEIRGGGKMCLTVKWDVAADVVLMGLWLLLSLDVAVRYLVLRRRT